MKEDRTWQTRVTSRDMHRAPCATAQTRTAELSCCWYPLSAQFPKALMAEAAWSSEFSRIQNFRAEGEYIYEQACSEGCRGRSCCRSRIRSRVLDTFTKEGMMRASCLSVAVGVGVDGLTLVCKLL